MTLKKFQIGNWILNFKKYFDVGRGNVIVIRVGGIRRQPSDGPGRYAVSAAAAHID